MLLVPKSNPAGVRSVYRLRAGGRRLAVGTAGVPIGDYTRKLLRAHAAHVDPAHEHASARSRTSASIIAKVALGSADAGFAYLTDGWSAQRPRRA